MSRGTDRDNCNKYWRTGMAKKNTKSAQNGKVKVSTDDMIDGAIARQNSWMSRRRDFAKSFLRKLNIFARSKNASERKAVIAAKEAKKLKRAQAAAARKENRSGGVTAYWFPILCAVIVMAIAVWVVFVRSDMNVKKDTSTTAEKITALVEKQDSKKVVAPVVPEPVVKTVKSVKIIKTNKPVAKAAVASIAPSFDIVRIDPDGTVIVAGRWLPNKNVSVVMNKKVVATEHTDLNGEFAYAPKHAFAPGNYTISLVGTDSNTKSENDVFIYVSEHGYKNSISLLMTKNGSTLLQSPKLLSGDLTVSKIDYLASGRIVVTGNALPRLRVSLTLNDKYLGFARVSDYKYFGLGADVEKLEPGKEYTLVIRLHDGDNKTVAEVKHKFTMPVASGSEDTFYTVRRGDCLWIIAKNFLRQGVLFSIIAEKNDIKNPNLIFPKQTLQIPIKVK